jgi:TolA-binding protein
LFVLRSRVAVAQGGDAAQQYTAAQAVLGAGRYPEAKAAFVDLCKLEPNVAEVHANPGAI